MIATFNIKVNIDNNNVTTDFNCEKIEKSEPENPESAG